MLIELLLIEVGDSCYSFKWLQRHALLFLFFYLCIVMSCCGRTLVRLLCLFFFYTLLRSIVSYDCDLLVGVLCSVGGVDVILLDIDKIVNQFFVVLSLSLGA